MLIILYKFLVVFLVTDIILLCKTVHFLLHGLFSVKGCEVNRDLLQHEDRHLEGQEPVSEPCTPENKVITDEVTLSALQVQLKGEKISSFLLF